MKTKITVLFCIICMLVGALAGCAFTGDTGSTSETSGTTGSGLSYTPIPPQFYDFNEFADAVKSKDKKVADLTKDLTELYRPEIKLEGYALGAINVFDGCQQYYFVPSEFAGEKWLDSDEADDCLVTVNCYGNGDMKKAASALLGGVEWLDDETFYHESGNAIYFKYENNVCYVVLPKTYEGDIDLSKVLEMTTVAIGE